MQNLKSTRQQGRDFLVSHLERGGFCEDNAIEKAGVDIFVRSKSGGGLAYPIRFRANKPFRFALYRDSSSIEHLTLVHVCNLGNATEPEIYALSFDESFKLLDQRGHTKSRSWLIDGGYSLSLGEDWLRILEPFRIAPSQWAARLRNC